MRSGRKFFQIDTIYVPAILQNVEMEPFSTTSFFMLERGTGAAWWHTQKCMHACMHAYIHTYIHIYIHTQASNPRWHAAELVVDSAADERLADEHASERHGSAGRTLKTNARIIEGTFAVGGGIQTEVKLGGGAQCEECRQLAQARTRSLFENVVWGSIGEAPPT